MGQYVEKNLTQNEGLAFKAKITGLAVLAAWIFGILFCWLLLIPLIRAIIVTIRFTHTELAVTSKRVMGKTGIVNTMALDAPLGKIQNASVKQGLGGKMFGYGTVQIDTAAGKYIFPYVAHPDEFKSALMSEIEEHDDRRVRMMASEIAVAIANVLGKTQAPQQ